MVVSRIDLGISRRPEEQRSIPAYGPEAIHNGHLIVQLNKHDVPLPLKNVGTNEQQIWIAYADVSANAPLAKHAHDAMTESAVRLLHHDPNIRAAITPQSSKSQDFFKEVMQSVSQKAGKEIPLIQIIGDTDMEKVIAESAPGLVTDCVSVLSKTKGIVKYFGMRPADERLLQLLGGEVLVLDDVATTQATLTKSTFLLNKAMRYSDDITHPMLTIFCEYGYGSGYQSQFAGIHTLGYIPEFTGPLPVAKS